MAVLFPSLHLQAAAPAAPTIDLTLPSAALTLGEVSLLGEQGCDMDDQDPEDVDTLNAVGPPPVALLAEMSSADETGRPAGASWSPVASDAPLAHPSEGYALRRRIFKKTR